MWIPNLSSTSVTLLIFKPLPSHLARVFFYNYSRCMVLVDLALFNIGRPVILCIIFFVINTGCSNHNCPLWNQLSMYLIHYTWKFCGKWETCVNPFVCRCLCSCLNDPSTQIFARALSIPSVPNSWIVHLKWVLISFIRSTLGKIWDWAPCGSSDSAMARIILKLAAFHSTPFTSISKLFFVFLLLPLVVTIAAWWVIGFYEDLATKLLENPLKLSKLLCFVNDIIMMKNEDDFSHFVEKFPLILGVIMTQCMTNYYPLT